MPPSKLQLIEEVLKVTQRQFSAIKDLDLLLDRVLFESRRFTHADSGSIFLTEGNSLHFSYVQNDTLFKKLGDNKHLYSSHNIPIDETSIAGYVALTGRTLFLKNAYRLPPGVPYAFNPIFDETSSYHTKSILTLPLKIGKDKIVGVMQLLNATNSKGKVVSFHPEHKLMAELFANEAAISIDRARMTRAIVLRMIKMAELRDPRETGAHVNRVGAYSIEIYHHWALKKGIPSEEIKLYKDNLRIAAMLHDVGKVAISDSILKKPGKLTEHEFNIMKFHTVAGAQLFEDFNSELEQLALEIALTHHEKWDGSGYPGYGIAQNNLHWEWDTRNMRPGIKGENIPLSGRIVALADVYDALISKRCYKDAWDERDVLKYIREQSGKHFDPSMVDTFFEIYDVIQAIREKYLD
jgi:HD-GYP domain-containing protein (c-di-GMP phosphodiesterase class II)